MKRFRQEVQYVFSPAVLPLSSVVSPEAELAAVYNASTGVKEADGDHAADLTLMFNIFLNI